MGTLHLTVLSPEGHGLVLELPPTGVSNLHEAQHYWAMAGEPGIVRQYLVLEVSDGVIEFVEEAREYDIDTLEELLSVVWRAANPHLVS